MPKKNVSKTEPKTKIFGLKEHIKNKPMWAGKRGLSTNLVYSRDKNKFIKQEETFSIALCKLIDEIVVNAIDHSLSFAKVNEIRIYFDSKTGMITVSNNGPGIPINVKVIRGDPIVKVSVDTFETMADAEADEEKKKEKSPDGKTDLYKIKWNPQVLFEHPFSGSNYKNVDEEIHVRGGTNGIGAKIVNYYSTLFEIYTYDKERKKYYYQRFDDGSAVIHEPKISKKYLYKDESMKKYTTIGFIPNYASMGYKKKFSSISVANKKIIHSLIETRCYHAAVYTNASVYFQDKKIPVKSLKDLVTLHIPIEFSSLNNEKSDEKKYDGESGDDELENSDDEPDEKLENSDGESDEQDEPEEKHVEDYCLNFTIKPRRPAIDVEKYEFLMKKKKKEIKKYDWNWDICITPNLGSGKSNRFSLVNGVQLDAGQHLLHIEDEIVAALRPKMENIMLDKTKRWNSNCITNNINIYMKGAVDCPSFDSQSKTNMREKKDKFDGYKVSKGDIAKIWEMMKPYLLSGIIDKFNSTSSKGTHKGGYRNIPKYTGASKAGKKRKSPTYLFIPEGDSAMTLIDKGLSNKKVKNWTYEYCGIFSIQGVPLNARRFVKIIKDPKTGDERILPMRKFMNNERLNSFIYVLGLDFTKKYKMGTAQGDKEYESLRYNHIIVAVDQDEDGKGNIFVLIMGLISLLWPELIKRGFIKRINTPIIRIYSKKSKKISGGKKDKEGKRSKNVIECKPFYSIPKFDKWVEENYDSKDDMSAEWKVVYFKGLAATSAEDVIKIFGELHDKILSYEWTDKSEKYFEIYLGKNADKRKKVLKTPDILDVEIDYEASAKKINKERKKISSGKGKKGKASIPLLANNNVNCEDHLQSDGKMFQRYNVQRSIPHSMDGLQPSRRKILYGGRGYFTRNKNNTQKVATFGGYVVEHTAYHHGEASLTSTITKMGQEFQWSNQLPLFRGNSICIGFGSRKKGGKDTGAPRYIKLKLNKDLTDLMYPAIDDWLLQYEFDDGNRCEPRYYLPILPMAILETVKLPAHGWQINSWARDWREVIEAIRAVIRSDIVKPAAKSLGINKCGWNGALDELDGKQFSFGKYKYDKKKNIVNIVELPHNVFPEILVKGNVKKQAEKKIDTLDFGDYVDEKLTKKNKGAYAKKIKGSRRARKKADADSGDAYTNLEAEIARAEAEQDGKAGGGDDGDDGDGDDIEPLNPKFKKLNLGSGLAIENKPTVDRVEDMSDDKHIDIRIHLKKGAYEYLHLFHNSVWSDPIIEHFGLRRSITDNLNFLNHNGEIKHYKKYESVFMDWFYERKKLYVKRVERLVIMLRLQIELREAKNKFARNYIGYKLTNKSDEVWEKKLVVEKYTRYCSAIIENPKFTPVDKIIYEATENKETISFGYIYDMNQRSLQTGAINRRETEIENLREKLSGLDIPEKKWKYFKGARLWLDELDAIQKVIERGTTDGWGSGEPKVVY